MGKVGWILIGLGCEVFVCRWVVGERGGGVDGEVGSGGDGGGDGRREWGWCAKNGVGMGKVGGV